MKTAVEWLVEQLTPSIALQQKYIDELKEQAKEIEKELIIDAFNEGYFYEKSAEQYYNETFNK